ncbi:MAG: autotransporter outer membrane beta-barrel domain-containing protein, partial [Martelella sp.]
SEAVDILGQLSGDVYASVSGAMVNSSRYVRDATGGQTRAAMGGIATPNDISTVSNYAAEASVQTPFGAFEETNSGIDVWFTGYGSWSTIDGDGNAATIKDTAGGMFIGADAAVGANMRLGAMVGYGQSSYEIDARDASGSSNDFTLGLYGGGAWNGFVADFGAAYTWHDVSLERQLNFSTFADTLQGDYDAGTFQVYGGVGYTFDITDNFQVEPFADAAYIHQQSGDFTEAGGLSALSHLDSEMNTWFTTVGVRAAFDFKLGQADSRITASAGWRHGFGDLNPAEQVRFTGGDFFNVAGAPLAEDQAVLSAGWETQINDMISVGINYSAQFGDGNKSQNVTGQLNIRF